MLFVRQKNSELAFVYQERTDSIIQLSETTELDWLASDYVLLNLTPRSSREFQEQWRQTLMSIFGEFNCQVIAELSKNMQTNAINSIQHLLLGLSFVRDPNDHLKCQQVPGYFLSNVQKPVVFQKFDHLITLENETGENETARRKIILPAFALQPGEKNNAFNHRDCVDSTTVCDPKHDYYIFELDKSGMPMADSIEANLYLAVLFRSYGEYELAFDYLNRAKTYKNLNESSIKIILQVLQRKIKSPLGSAFDLKLASYLHEHQQKFAEDKELLFEDLKLPDNWYELMRSQLQFYKATKSAYKEGVSIYPDYARINDDELDFLESDYPPIEQRLNERLDEISKLPEQIFKYRSAWKSFISSFWKSEHGKISVIFWKHDESEPSVIDNETTLRVYGKADKKQTATAKYLLKNFHRFFSWALNPDDHIKLRKKIFSLLHNDRESSKEFLALLSLLHFAMEFPDLFERRRNYDPMEIGKLFKQHQDECRDIKLSLYDDVSPISKELEVLAKPSDFPVTTVEFVLGEIAHKDIEKFPLEIFFENYFSKHEIQISTTPFQLTLEGLGEASLLDEHIFNRFEQGHKANREAHKIQYSLKEGVTLADLKRELNLLIKLDIQESQELLFGILQDANDIPGDSNIDLTIDLKGLVQNLELSRANELRPKISRSDLEKALLTQSHSKLLYKNPFLTQDQLNNLLTRFVDYTVFQSRIEQIKDIQKQIANKENFSDFEEYELQKIAQAVDTQRYYEANAYPEFLIYEYATGRILRRDQTEILIRLITLIEDPIQNPGADADANADEGQMHHGLLQFAAGGGKTSVLIPILAQRFSRKGFLPVIINTSELYDIALKEIPKNLRASFKQNLEVIEYGLDHNWTVEELEQLLSDLQRWQREGKCLLITPVTWHTLNITMKMGFMNKVKDKGALFYAANNVLEFFKHRTVKLEDECHIVSDPMQQSIKSTGSLQKLAHQNLDVLMHFYKHLMGVNDTEDPSCLLAGIKEGRKRPITADELHNLQETLATQIAEKPCFAELDKNDFINYLLQADRQRPEWLMELRKHPDGKELCDQIVLARSFIQSHLPYILTLQANKDYGPSINSGDMTAAPKREGKDLKSHFADPVLVAGITIQMYHQRGLQADQIKQLLNYLIHRHREERKSNKNLKLPTQADVELLNLIPPEYDIGSCRSLTNEMIEQLCNDERITQDPAIIEYYLNLFVLPQIGTPDSRLGSTAPELQAGFKRSILFSATPGLLETLPAFLDDENCLLDSAFEAKVIDTLLQEHNSGICILEKSQSPEEFLQQIPVELLENMMTLIDRGALLTDFEAENVIEAYLKLGGIVTQTGVCFSEKKLHLRSNASEIEDMHIEGAGLVAALHAQGLQPERFLLFLFLDLSKTTGTDIKRPYNDHAGLTIGKGQTVTETIQAAMRERQLLDDNAQSISWLIFMELYREIYPEDEERFDPKKLFYWMIKNEAEQTESKIINRAYQGIAQAVYEVVWEILKQDINAYNTRDLNEQIMLSIYDSYEIDSKLGDSKDVLNSYLQTLLKKFRLEPEDLPQFTQDRIQKILLQTTSLVTQLENPAKTQLGNEVNQEQELEVELKLQQQQKQRMKTRLDKMQGFTYAVELYDLNIDQLSLIFHSGSEQYKSLQFKNISTPKLLINPRQFAVTEAANDENITQLKPIKMLLVQLSPEGDLKYLALTAAGAEFYADQLNDPSLSAKDSGYALINLEGDILQFSKNTSLEQCENIISTAECQQMLHYVEFLNGKIRDPLQLSTVVKEHGWDERDYKALSKLVHSVHVSHHPVELQDNRALQQACGWSDTPQEALQKAHERYRYPDVTLTELNRRELHAIDRDDIDISATPMRAETIITPSVFGEKPVSFSYLETSPELRIITKKVASLEKQKMSDPRRLARAQLQSNVDCILKSRLSLPEKEELIESFYDSYIAFETLLVDLYETMRSYTAENTNLENIKRDVLAAIKQSFTAYSQDVDIDDCCQELKTVLDNKKTEASSEVKKLNAKFEHKMFQLFNKKSNPIEIFNAMEKKLERFDSERAEGLKFTV